MEVLVVLWDGGGNVPPALSLATALSQRDHDVTVASHARLQTQVEERGLMFLPFTAGHVYDPSERTTG